MTKTLAWIAILSLIAPAAAGATDTAGAAVTAPAITIIAPGPAKPHDQNRTVPPAGTGPGNEPAPDMSNNLGNNNAGNPNMGSSDHTPGTTGTSGQ